MNLRYLGSALLTLTLPAAAQVVVIDFTSTVTTITGTPTLPASLGDTITGHLEINLATLPADTSLGSTLGVYSYFNRDPGFTFGITLNGQTTTYDSIHASQEGGFTPSIGLSQDPSQHVVNFLLREQGNPYHMSLTLVDATQPIDLLAGKRFPQDIRPFVIGPDIATFDYATEDNSSFVHASVTQLSMSQVPEPSTAVLVTGLLMLVPAGARAMRRTPGHG